MNIYIYIYKCIYIYLYLSIYLYIYISSSWTINTFAVGSHLAQAGGADVEAKAAAEEESRKRAENYEKAQQAQKRRMAEQAEAKVRSEAKARTSTPPKYVQPKPMPAKPGPVTSKAKPVPAKPMPAPPPMPKHVAWFLANSTVSVEELPPELESLPPKAKALPPPATRGAAEAKAYAAAVSRQVTGTDGTCSPRRVRQIHRDEIFQKKLAPALTAENQHACCTYLIDYF